MMAQLLPLILEVSPQLAKYLFGTKGVQAAAAVAAIAQQVTGTVEPEAQLAALADPNKVADLRLELAQLTARLDVEQRASDLALFQTQITDVMNARQMTLNLQAGRSPIAWGAPVVSVVVLATFGAMLGCLLTFHIPDSALALSNVMLGTLGTLTSAVVNYWVGSSSGSRAKDAVIADTARSLAVTTTPKELSPPT